MMMMMLVLLLSLSLFLCLRYVHSYAVHDVYGVHALDPSTWTLQASKDGISWIVLDTALNTPWISEDGVYYNSLGGVSYNMV